jgi:pimeloyl-ACP methyl ester carboxylesterase
MPQRSFTPSLRRVAKWLLSTVVVLYALLVALLYVFQDAIIVHPMHAYQSFRPVPGVRVADWSPRGKYSGVVMEPESGTLRGTILFTHGNTGSAEDREDLGATFVKHGYRAVLVEYPGFGRRPGKPSIANAAWAGKAAFQAAREQWAGPYLLAGESLGAGMAAQVAKDQGAYVSAVMLFLPWDSLAAVVQEKVRFVPAHLLLHNDYDSKAALASYKGRLSLIAAERDSVIPVPHARALADSHPGTGLTIQPGAEHWHWFELVSDRQWSDLLDKPLPTTASSAR